MQRETLKFEFSVRLLSVDNLSCKKVCVAFSRGPKLAVSSTVGVRDGSAIFSAEEGTVEFTSSLSKGTSGFGEKKFKCALKKVSCEGVSRTIGALVVNIAAYAGVESSTSVDWEFKTAKGTASTVKAIVTSRWLQRRSGTANSECSELSCVTDLETSMCEPFSPCLEADESEIDDSSGKLSSSSSDTTKSPASVAVPGTLDKRTHKSPLPPSVAPPEAPTLPFDECGGSVEQLTAVICNLRQILAAERIELEQARDEARQVVSLKAHIAELETALVDSKLRFFQTLDESTDESLSLQQSLIDTKIAHANVAEEVLILRRQLVSLEHANTNLRRGLSLLEGQLASSRQ